MAEINVGQISEALNNKADLDLNNTNPFADYVVEYQRPTAENNYTWYRLYKSGWIEQGGWHYQTSGNSSGAHTITFIKPFSNTSYHVIFSLLHEGNGGTPNDIYDKYAERTNTSMYIYITAAWKGYTWEAKGFAAQS